MAQYEKVENFRGVVRATINKRGRLVGCTDFGAHGYWTCGDCNAHDQCPAWKKYNGVAI